MRRSDRLLMHLVVGLNAAPGRRGPRERPEIAVPGDRRSLTARQALIFLLAISVPISIASLSIALRAEHLVPAALVALGALSLVLAGMSSRLARLAASDRLRRAELDHLIAFVRESGRAASVDELGTLACEHLGALLGLRNCEWIPHARETWGVVLLPSGGLMGASTEQNPDRGKLPVRVQLPVIIDGRQHGHFAMTADEDRLTSIEERRTAAVIAEIVGRAAQTLTAPRSA